MTKLNLGCGELLKVGYINIDKSTQTKADLIWDITNGLPQFENKSIEEVHAGCVLEQLTQEQFLLVVNECHRVLKDGGKLEGYVPSTDPRVLYLNPMDKMFFQEDSFKYLCKNEIHWQRFGVNYGFLGWSSYSASTNAGGIILFELVK